MTNENSVSASMNASAMRSVPRMSPAASGWRAIPSIARVVAQPWLNADIIAGKAMASVTASCST
mgnify:CR=1 FL=1